METSGFRPDHHQSHVPQQSRRDKLRVQQVLSSTPISHHLDNLSNSLDHQFTLHQDHVNLHARNVRHHSNFLYDQHGMINSSEILDFSRNTSAVLQQHRNALTYQDLGSDHRAMGGTGSDVPPSFMINWSRSLNPNAAQSFDNWPAVTNFASANSNSLALGSGNNEANGVANVVASAHDMATLKPGRVMAQPSLAHVASTTQVLGQDVGQKYYLEAMNLATPSSTSTDHLNYHNNNNNNNSSSNNILQDQVVTVASTRDMIRSENELALLPFSFASLDNDHQNWTTSTDQLGNFNRNTTKKRDEDHSRTTIVNDSNFQGLSLSLSSINTQSTLPNIAHIPADQGSSGSDQDLPKPVVKPGHHQSLCSIPKPSIISKACGKSLQDIVGVSSSAYRSTTGPLGPFTGYATILKNSRFLKPAQQLLDEFCGSKLMSKSSTSTSCDVNSERFSGEAASASISASAHDHDRGHAHVNAMDQSSTHDHQVISSIKGNNNNNNNNSSASSSTFYGSNEINSGDHGGVGSNISFESGSSRPEQVQQKKAKLLYMQEEVSRRYKQYRQQMQMVVSSFESVAGLSSATPYISLALKVVSRHFRCLKSAIADQLNHTRKALGEDLSSPTTGTSSSKGADAISTVSRLKYIEQSFQKHKSGGANMAFPEPQQHHIWRPQRGLPERSVAVLRAWLFEHFLHPYPTDTDKHMLATQTGLTRNQVSNWFINARVRVWKPMVEEIHTLETKGLSADQVDKNLGNNKHNDGNIPASNDHQASSTRLGSGNVFPNKQLECSGTGNYSVGHNRSELFGTTDQHEQSQEKRSRLECQAPSSNMAGAVVQGFVPYHRSGLEVWSRAEQ